MILKQINIKSKVIFQGDDLLWETVFENFI